MILELNVTRSAIRTALRNAGYARRVARRKPPISERNRIARRQWAIEHRHWTFDDWKKILWSDETWVNGDRHTKTYVTRKAGEEWDSTCILERFQRRQGWMFWGCFMVVQKSWSILGERMGYYQSRKLSSTNCPYYRRLDYS